jgi:Protein of unknown function (DUF3866)
VALSLRRGRVSAVVERHEGLVRVEVDGVPCVAYPELTGPVALDDEVLVNVQARKLQLGSGGFDVLYANLTRGLELAAAEQAHVTKLPYTPLQLAVRHGEEDGPLAESLDGMPVVCCSLHSQLAPACAALAGRRVTYLQLPGGALPVALSDSVRAVRSRRLVGSAVGVGACFGGDVDCVNAYSALAWAKGSGAEVAVCGVGPGIVGTGAALGHGGMSAADALGAAAALGGRPILALRVSQADPRPRHRGVSHHSEAILRVGGASVVVPWPDGCPIEHPLAEGAEIVAVEGWREACDGLPLSHMGRGPDDDPWFFAAAFAAGTAARRLLT